MLEDKNPKYIYCGFVCMRKLFSGDRKIHCDDLSNKTIQVAHRTKMRFVKELRLASARGKADRSCTARNGQLWSLDYLCSDKDDTNQQVLLYRLI